MRYWDKDVNGFKRIQKPVPQKAVKKIVYEDEEVQVPIHDTKDDMEDVIVGYEARTIQTAKEVDEFVDDMDNYTPYPEVSDELYNALMEEAIKSGRGIMTGEDGMPRLAPKYEPSAEEKAKTRIQELKAKLAATDYQAIKYAEGEMNAEEYAPIKAQRAEWRAEINALEELTGGNE